MRTSLLAALGLVAAGWAAPASATMTAAPAFAFGEVPGVHEITDRGSWIEPKTRWKRDHNFGVYRGYDDHHHRKHYKKKKRRKHFKHGYKRGYSRGYDEGYYDARRYSRFERRRRHSHRHYYPDHRFGGGFYFDDGYYRGGSFRFRY